MNVTVFLDWGIKSQETRYKVYQWLWMSVTLRAGCHFISKSQNTSVETKLSLFFQEVNWLPLLIRWCYDTYNFIFEIYLSNHLQLSPTG